MASERQKRFKEFSMNKAVCACCASFSDLEEAKKHITERSSVNHHWTWIHEDWKGKMTLEIKTDPNLVIKQLEEKNYAQASKIMELERLVIKLQNRCDDGSR